MKLRYYGYSAHETFNYWRSVMKLLITGTLFMKLGITDTLLIKILITFALLMKLLITDTLLMKLLIFRHSAHETSYL
jgi:hypothetical protein